MVTGDILFSLVANFSSLADNRMATLQVTSTRPFNFSCLSDWVTWIRQYKHFQIASGINKHSKSTKVNLFIYLMGDQANDILRSFNLSEEDMKKYTYHSLKLNLTVTSLKEGMWFLKEQNLTWEARRWWKCRWFHQSTLWASRHCNYGALHEEMICDRLVFGIRDSKLSENLRLDSELTLEKAIAQARQKETVKQQQPLLRGGSINKTTPEALVGVVNKKPTSTNPGNSQTSHLWNKKESPKEYVLIVANLLLMTTSTVHHVKLLATSVVNKVISNYLFADLWHQ